MGSQRSLIFVEMVRMYVPEIPTRAYPNWLQNENNDMIVTLVIVLYAHTQTHTYAIDIYHCIIFLFLHIHSGLNFYLHSFLSISLRAHLSARHLNHLLYGDRYGGENKERITSREICI